MNVGRKRRAARPRDDAFRRVPQGVQESRRAAEKQEIRAEALRRFARMQGGKPVMCTPPSDVVQAKMSAGEYSRKAKVIFKTLEDAEAFAALVAGLDRKSQTAYVCEFSRHGHAHLTTDD